MAVKRNRPENTQKYSRIHSQKTAVRGHQTAPLNPFTCVLVSGSLDRSPAPPVLPSYGTKSRFATIQHHTTRSQSPPASPVLTRSFLLCPIELGLPPKPIPSQPGTPAAHGSGRPPAHRPHMQGAAAAVGLQYLYRAGEPLVHGYAGWATNNAEFLVFWHQSPCCSPDSGQPRSPTT